MVSKPFIEFKRINTDAMLPTRGTPGAAGWDLYAYMLDTIGLQPGERKLISTGVASAIPSGWVGIIKPRSSMALKGITTDAGVIDEDYRGEVKVMLVNTTEDYFWIEPGDRVAQMVVLPYLGDAIEVKGLERSLRMAAGFGSTGR